MESFLKVVLCVLSIPFASDAFLPRINLAKEETVTRDHIWITKIGLMVNLAKFLGDNPQYLKDQKLTDFLSIVVSANSTEAAQKTIGNLLPQLNFIIALSEIQNANAEVDAKPLSSSAAAHFNAEQFKDGFQRLVNLRKELITALLNGDKLQHARNLAGEILHTLQDFYSNTNWIELGNQEPYEVLSTLGSFIPYEFTAQLKEATCKNCASTPVTMRDCSSNLITDKLTSGYRAGQDVTKPVNKGKCSHGGRMDESRLKPATGGMNKDTDSLKLSPHARLHKAAADLATEATRKFFDDVRTTVGDDIFARFLNLKSEKSMALVIDVSGSMSDEIAYVKDLSIEFVRQTMQKRGTFFTYILVPFSDPDWGPVTVTSDADVVIKAVTRLRADGGGDCPELGMTGLYNALLYCLPNSNMFYFSDADSKDEFRRDEVLSLAKEKKVQINFILSGSCSRRKRDLTQATKHQTILVEQNRGDQRLRRSVHGQDLYRILATETGGQVLKTSKSNVGDVIKVIDPVGSTNSSADLKEVGLLNVEESGSHHFADVRYLLDVDSTLQNLIVILSVESSPAIAVNNVKGNATIQQKVISSSNTLLIKELTELVSGTIELAVTCNGPYSLQVTGSSPLDFTYQLLDVEDLERGTTRRVIGNPLRGHTLLLTLDFVGQQINSVYNLTLLALNGTKLETFRITQGKGIYRDSYFVTFVPTSELFRLGVSGLDNQGTPFQRVKPTLFALGDVELSQNIPNKNASNAIFPGEMLHLGVKVSNTGDQQTLFLSASDDFTFVQNVTPNQLNLESNETSVVTLSLLAPENSTYGTTSTVTVFAYGNSDRTQVINFIVLYVTVTSKNPDVTAPSCEVLNSTGSCAELYGSSECVNSAWSVKVTFNDTGEGLLSISTRENHNGNLSVSPFSRGVVNTSVPASFTSNCCNPKVLFVGLDLVGNMATCYVSLVPNIVSLSAKPYTTNVSLSLGEDTRVPFSLTNHGSKGSFSFHVTKSSSLLGYVFPFSLTMNTNVSREGHVIVSSYGENSSFERLTVQAVSKSNYVNRKRVTLFDIWVSVVPKTQPTSRPTPTKHVTLRVVPPDRNEVSLKPGRSLELNFTVENLALPDTFSFHVSAEKPSVTGHVEPSPVFLKSNHSVACLLMLSTSSDAPPDTATQLNVTAKSASRDVKEFQVFSLTVKVDLSSGGSKVETSGKKLEMWHVVVISLLGGIAVFLVVIACFVYCKISHRSKRQETTSTRAITEGDGCIHVNRWAGDVVLTNLP